MNRKILIEKEKEIIKLSETKTQKQLAELFNITQSGIFLILKRNNSGCKKKSRVNMSKLSLDVDYFKEINSYEKAYWLGYICADGSINVNNNKMTLISKDKEIISKFKKDVKSSHKLRNNSYFDKRTNKRYFSYSIQITNELFVKNLINLGITNKKTDILYFPLIEEKYYAYFIAGLFDGDGSLSIIDNKIRINLISTLDVLMYIQEFILKKYEINKLKMSKVSKNKINVWKLYLYKDAINFLNFIYSDNNFIYLQRKYLKYENYKK